MRRTTQLLAAVSAVDHSSLTSGLKMSLLCSGVAQRGSSRVCTNWWATSRSLVLVSWE